MVLVVASSGERRWQNSRGKIKSSSGILGMRCPRERQSPTRHLQGTFVRETLKLSKVTAVCESVCQTSKISLLALQPGFCGTIPWLISPRLGAIQVKGAEVNTQAGYYRNALQAASYRGHEQVVRLLLENGAEVNAQAGYYGNALQAASCRGHEQVVRLLLENGAEVNAQGGSYGNALQAASMEGKEQVVRLLLENGAEVNAQGGYYGNALQAASYKGHEQVVLLLLENCAEVNHALQVASGEGLETVVRRLLKLLELDKQDCVLANALHAAWNKGHEVIVEVLLEHGAVFGNIEMLEML